MNSTVGRASCFVVVTMGYLANCRSGAAVSTCASCTKAAPQQCRKLKVFRLQELARATNSFSPKNLLGKGSHACVYKAVLSDGQVVAVKRPTTGRRALEDVTSFDNELEVLSRLNHRHLVNLIGYCNESSEKLLVVEFMGNGTLFDLLHSRTEPLSWPLRVHMAFQAAKAILALHSASPPIVHRDVKSSNILVDSNWNAKLGDLGLALPDNREDVAMHRIPPAGTMGYIDPQYQTPSQLSTKSDVFSFGILLLEIMSGRNAIDVRFNPSSIVDWAVPLIRRGKSLALCDPALKPPPNIEAVKQLAAIAARSVRLSRDRRPRMVEIVEGLRQIRRKLPIPRFGRKQHRNTIDPKPVGKGENVEDSSDGASSCKSEILSIFNEGSLLGAGNSSPADSLESSCSLMSARVMDSRFGGDHSSTESSPAAPTVTRNPERPLLDRSSSSGSSMSPVRTEGAHYFTSSICPVPSPGRYVYSHTDWSGKRSWESPTFGSIEALEAADLRLSTAIVSQQANSRFQKAGMYVLQSSPPQQRNFNNLKNIRESCPAEEATFTSSLPSKGISKLDATNEGMEHGLRGEELLGVSKLVYGNGICTPTRASTALGTAMGDLQISEKSLVCLNAGSSLQPAILFTRDFSPIWSANASTMTLYSNSESQFEKVDLPIAV